jgi:hypothetical protein
MINKNKELFLDAIFEFYCKNMQTDKSPWEDKSNVLKRKIVEHFHGNENDFLFVEAFINAFACDTEHDAFLSGLKFLQDFMHIMKDINHEDIWYKEIWTDEDLVNALQYRCIEPTEENIAKLREGCKGLFDDKSTRNEMIDDKVCNLFNVDL